MKNMILIPVLAAGLALPFGLGAQEEEKETYIYATYFYCKADMEEQADELIEKNTKPIYDAAVADGTIAQWGWVSHHTGGKWRRIQYHMSDSVAGLLKAQETLSKRMEDAGVSNDGFAKACSSHDDYIWQVESGNGITDERATAGMSVYHECQINKEERADEIVEKVFAPVYNKAVEEGKIKSWGWNSHVVGGKYRRLGTMTADSFEGLIAARGEILQALYGDGDNAVANEFSDICTSHSDYLWNIVHEK
ncbi:MAG: hypothetical protein KJO72_10080 [Gammaproteobacteria bacterium]|nr:hypothetical protein [Gammaproteobacteria bacterium]